MNFLKNKKIQFLFGLILLAPFVYFAGIDSIKNLAKPNFAFLSLSFVFTVLAYLIDGVRWGIITNGITQKKICSYKDYFFIYVVSMSVGTFFSQAGGMFLLRPLIIKKKHNLDYKYSFVSLVTEKSVDLFFLTLFLLNSIIFFFYKDPFLTSQTLFFSLLVGYLLYVKYGYFLERLSFYALQKIQKFKGKTNNETNELDIKSLDKKSVHIMALASILRIFIYGFRIFFLVEGINLSIDYLILLLSIPISQLSLIFSITPGALGILEGGWFGALTFANIPQETIGKFLIGQRFYWIVFNLITLFFYLLFLKKTNSAYDFKNIKTDKLT